MALIKCPGCGKNVSEYAKTCPHCGYPIAETKETNAAKRDKETSERSNTNTEDKLFVKPHSRLFFSLFISALLIFFCVALISAIPSIKSRKKSTAASSTSVSTISTLKKSTKSEVTQNHSVSKMAVDPDVFGDPIYWGMAENEVETAYNMAFSPQTDADGNTAFHSDFSEMTGFTYDPEGYFNFGSNDQLSMIIFMEKDPDMIEKDDSKVLQDADALKISLNDKYGSSRQFASQRQLEGTYWDTEKGTLIFHYKAWYEKPEQHDIVQGYQIMAFAPGDILSAPAIQKKVLQTIRIQFQVPYSMMTSD